MRANRKSLLLGLLALACAGTAGLRADDIKGQYQGTIQTTQINEKYLLERGLDAVDRQPMDPSGAGMDPARRAQVDAENRQISRDITKHRNKMEVDNLKWAKVTDVNSFIMMITDGQTRGQHGLELGPASSTYMRMTVQNLWNPTPDNQFGTIQANWRSDGFEIVRTQATVQTAEGDKDGKWTSVVAAAILLFQ